MLIGRSGPLVIWFLLLFREDGQWSNLLLSCVVAKVIVFDLVTCSSMELILAGFVFCYYVCRMRLALNGLSDTLAAPQAVNVFCEAATWDWNLGVIMSLSTKDLVVVAFGVVNLTYIGSVADVRIWGGNNLWWLAVP
jgi:hypothetical protein